jgi:hypothetical protein
MGMFKLTEVDWFLELFEQTSLQHHLIMLDGRISVTKELERMWKWSWSINTFSALMLTDWEKR